MKVNECMTRDVRIVDVGDTVQDAAQIMAQIDAGVLPVRENDRLVGVITDRDIAIRGVGRGCAADAKVGEVMSPEVKYCFEDDEVEDILLNMGDIQVRRLPVLDHAKQLVGIVSIGDLARGETAETGETLVEITRISGQHSQMI
ncbi:MAG TPA: CBS domain-containing protein [Sphingomonadaceae bacterium]|jgi:CBS domain-containing protein|nr:CBS domain-containing protein [Sphingomonadaceae bacterium]